MFLILSHHRRYSMCNQVVPHDFLPESEYVWIIGIDRRTNPMGIGMTKGRHSCEVLDDPATRRSDQRLVNAEDVRIPVDVDHGLAERERFLFQRGEKGIVAGLSAAGRR